MLKILGRHAAPLARASCSGAAVPWVCALLVLLAASVWAPAMQAAEAPVPAAAASTPLQHYQGWRDEPLQDWREANERVGAIGGWRTYLREAQPGREDADNAQAQHGHHGH